MRTFRSASVHWPAALDVHHPPPFAHSRPAGGALHHARRRGGERRLRDAAGVAPADPADRHHRPAPPRFAPVAAHSERSQLGRARHARHARQRRGLPADRLAGAVRADPHRSRRCACGGRRRSPSRSGRRSSANSSVRRSNQFWDAVRSDLRARPRRPRRRGARADPALAPGAAGRARLGGRPPAGAEQRGRRGDRAARADDLFRRPAAGGTSRALRS